ncbi:MAG: GntR family transcriptional regulator [Phormidesmis sp.]
MPIPETAVFNRSFMRDDVYQSLRMWIVSGELKPGEKLKDKELAAHLGVSRTPVRESLRRLEDEGLVETSPNRWTRVALVSREDAENIYPIIQQLELLALSLAFPRLTKRHIGEMRQLNDQLRDALEGRDAEDSAEIDAKFHQVIIDTAGNNELSTILEHVKIKYHRIELAYFGSSAAMMASVEEHNMLVVALEEGSLERAKAALAQNWHASIQRLREIKSESEKGCVTENGDN